LQLQRPESTGQFRASEEGPAGDVVVPTPYTRVVRTALNSEVRVKTQSPPADRTASLHKGFDRRAISVRPLLVSQFGSDLANALLHEARKEFEQMVPALPYAGGAREPMASSIVATAQMLAIALPLKHRGIAPKEIGRFLTAAMERVTERGRFVPKGVVRVLGKLVAPFLRRRFRAFAEASQRRDDPDEFVYEIVEGSGLLAMNITRCAVCTLYSRHDAMDLVPYMCAFDDQLSDVLGLGLRRTGTRALGATHCDFRYDPGGQPLRLRDQFDLPIGG
jgi:hypothetical protein